MPLFDDDVEERNRKHAEALHSGSKRCRSRLIVTPVSMPIPDDALETVFRNARTHKHWQDRPVTPAVLMAIYDLMRWGPTSANCSPARILFIVSRDAKERLR